MATVAPAVTSTVEMEKEKVQAISGARLPFLSAESGCLMAKKNDVRRE